MWILVPWTRIEPASPALEVQTLNHWTEGSPIHSLDSIPIGHSLVLRIVLCGYTRSLLVPKFLLNLKLKWHLTSDIHGKVCKQGACRSIVEWAQLPGPTKAVTWAVI